MPSDHGEGPYAEKPDFAPPPGKFTHPASRRWAQVRNGDWYAFAALVGPGREWGIEHPRDPNFWRPKERAHWCCRHEWEERTDSPARRCRCAITLAPTDDEIRTAEEGLRRLITELSQQNVAT